MKKIFVVFTAVMLVFPTLFAQEKTRMRPKDRLMIGLFTDMWTDLPGNMDTRTINRGVSIDYVQDFPISTSNFSVAAGLGFMSHNLYVDEDYLYQWDNDNQYYDFLEITEDFDKNKLSLNYLSVPVELRYRSRSLPNTLRVHAGLRAGLLVNAHTKYVGDDLAGTGREVKFKEGKLDNIENFLLGLHGRIGYGRVNFYAYIPLTDLFEGNGATENATFTTLGLSFIIF